MTANYDPHGTEDDSHAADDIEPSTLLRRARRPRRRGRAVRAALAVGGLVVTLTLALAVAGFAWLGRGPISLESLQPAIAASLQSRLAPGFKVALGPTAIMRGPHGVGIGFSGLSIRDARGRAVVDAPGGRIGLDAIALLGLSVKVRRLELDGLQLALRVSETGELSLSAGAEDVAPISLGPAPAGPAVNNPGALVAGLAEVMAGADQPLDHVAIVDGRLTVLTAGRDRAAVYDDFKLSFDRSGAGATAGLSARGPSGDWNVLARAEGGATRRLIVEARQLAVDDLLRLNPHPPGFSFDSPVSFQFDAQATPNGALTALKADFSLGAGRLVLPDPDNNGPPLALDEITGAVSLDPAGRYRLDKVEALAGATHARFGGVFSAPSAADPFWRASLHSRDVVIAPLRPEDPAAKLEAVDLEAHFDPAAKTFELEKATMRGPRLNGEITARVRVTDAGPDLKLSVSGSGSVMQALRLWPTFVVPDARTWCVENIHGGELAAGSIRFDWDAAMLADVLAKKPAPAESVDGHFTLRDVSATLLPGLPSMTGVDATGAITGRVLRVDAPRGVMELGSGRKLTGTDLFYLVPDTAPAARVAAQGGARVGAGADALAELLSLDALKKYVGVALDPGQIKGQFQGDLKLDLTIGKGVQPEEQKFRVNGALSGLSLDKFLGNAKLEQGALDVVADRGQIKMTGTGQVFGSPAKLELAKAAQDVGSLVLTGQMDEATRAKLGFNSGPRIRGPIGLKLKAPLDKSGADVEIDLAKATLDSLGGPPWKAAGRPGKATFQVKPAGEGVAVSNLAVEAGSLSARGSAQFGPDGQLKSLKLTALRMSASDDLKLDLDGGERAKLTLRGAALDARGVIKGLTGGDGGERDSQPLDLDVKVGAAIGNNREQIVNFEMSGARRNGGFSGLEARGRIGQGAFSARSGEGGVINIKSDDAGALARFLDVYGKMDGGTIELSVRTSGDTAKGTATIKRFAIRDEPSLRQLEQAAPPRANLPRGGGVSGADAPPPVRFDKLTATFARTGGKLDVKDGIVSNAAYALKTEGFIDFAHDAVDLHGVFVPLSQFNNALGGIPLLGQLLTGGQNEGVFAINYRVSGAASGPTLNINPLSGMTPGILRKMFGAIDGTTPSPAPDSPDSYAPVSPSR